MKKYLIYIPIIAVLVNCKLFTENSPPKINQIVATPSQPTSGQVVILNAIATDSDGDNLSYNWSVSAGLLENNGIGNPIQWTTPNSGGEINIICVVSDGKDVDTKNVTLIINYNYGILKGYIYDNYTKAPFGNHYVFINDVSKHTNSNGYYEFDNLNIGEVIIYTREGENNYSSYRDTIQISGGENIHDIYLNKSRVLYNVYVKEDSTITEIDYADVYVGPYILKTGSNGSWNINFDGKEIGETYNYQVTKAGYKTFNDSLTIIGKDTSFVTYLERE